jgi:hypothetical protein
MEHSVEQQISNLFDNTKHPAISPEFGRRLDQPPPRSAVSTCWSTIRSTCRHYRSRLKRNPVLRVQHANGQTKRHEKRLTRPAVFWWYRVTDASMIGLLYTKCKGHVLNNQCIYKCMTLESISCVSEKSLGGTLFRDKSMQTYVEKGGII